MTNSALITTADAVPMVAETAAIIQVIERAASNPAVDIDKMERLLAMQERILTRNAEANFNDAMSACQSAMTRISADASNPQTRSKYASYANLDRHLRPIYTNHGLSLSFGTKDAPAPEVVRVVCIVAKGGFSREYQIDMPADGKGAKGGDVMTKTHATGSGVSYGMRYLLKMIFNVAVGEDDNDGNGDRVSPSEVHLTPSQEGYAEEFGAKFKAILAADRPEEEVAAEVYGLHMEATEDQSVYVAASKFLTSKERSAWKKYIAIHKRNEING